jgi:hypothetical protein
VLGKDAWDASWDGAGFGFGDSDKKGRCMARIWVKLDMKLGLT